jgi:hypothetical protein
MTKKKAKVYFIGLMAENTKEVGKMVSNMEKDIIHQQVGNLNKVSGKKEKGFNGLID